MHVNHPGTPGYPHGKCGNSSAVLAVETQYPRVKEAEQGQRTPTQHDTRAREIERPSFLRPLLKATDMAKPPRWLRQSPAKLPAIGAQDVRSRVIQHVLLATLDSRIVQYIIINDNLDQFPAGHQETFVEGVGLAVVWFAHELIDLAKRVQLPKVFSCAVRAGAVDDHYLLIFLHISEEARKSVSQEQ